MAQSIFTNAITDPNPSAANPFTTGQVVDANLTVSGIGRGAGINAAAATNRFNASGWNSISLDENDYFEFVITPNAGYEIDFISFVYTSQASGTGPTQFAFRSSIDGYMANIGTPATAGATISIADAAFQNVSGEIRFRLFGWAASGAGGTFSINDFTFNGTVTAIPTVPTPIFSNDITNSNPSAANPFTEGQVVDANLTVSGIGRGSGINANAGSNRYNANNWNSAALDVNDYFEFVITPNAGYKFDLVSFVYTGQKSGTGPGSFAFRSSLDGFVSDIGEPTATGATISLSAAAYQNVSGATTFRLYGWAATGSTGTFSINDFVFNGTVSAIPVIVSPIFTNAIDGTNPNVDNPFTSGQVVNSNLTVSGIGRGTGINGANATGRYNASGWNSAALDENDYFEFVITPKAGYEIDFSSFEYTGQASGTGPTQFGFRSSKDGYVENIGTPTNAGTTISLADAAYQNVSGEIRFRLFGWGASGAGGTFSVNSFAFNGTVSSGSATPFLLSINDVSVVEGNSGTTNAVFTVSLSSPAPAGGVTFDIATADNTATTANNDYVAKSLTGQTIAAGASTYTFTVLVNGDLVSEPNETFFVSITNLAGASPGDMQGLGTIVNDDFAITLISTIQGSGAATPLANQTVSIEGIVTRIFSGASKLNGFYVQEEDTDSDGNPLTSEAIFVFDPTGLFTGNAGDKVVVTGVASEFTSSASGNSSSLTLIRDLVSVNNLGSSTLPAIVNIQLPVSDVSFLERYEGMLVNVSAMTGNLTVTENFQLGRFGQIILAATGASNQPGTDARFDQYTQFNAPSVTGYTNYLADLRKRRIYLDDGSGMQNPDPILFGRGGNPLSATNTLRSGDAVSTITGVLDERFEGYRIQTSTSVNFTPANPRPNTPPAVGGTIKVGSFNVLNYFNGDGLGGGFPTSRGASSAVEFTRQRDKIIKAILDTEADIVGLLEIESDGYGPNSAIQDLVNGLNAIAGAGTFSFIVPAASLGTDAITAGLLYKPAKVNPLGATGNMPNGFGTGSFDVVGRKPLAQTFQETAPSAQIFTVVVNHFKSKGSSSGGIGDSDANDGQGLSNGTRTRQAQDLANWLATQPTGTTDKDYLLIGDFNAYAKEDPLTALANAGYINLSSETSYSYVFEGQQGALDHALASDLLKLQVTGAEKWHINADEPTVMDYNTEFKSAGQITSLYNADVFRSSDHDPIVIGLNLADYKVWYRDVDGDGFGKPNLSKKSVLKPRGFVDNANDCRDNDKDVYPGAKELPDGKDNDCDGQIDEGLECRMVWYRDVDGDGFGKPNLTIRSCLQPKGFVDNADDCRDEDPTVYPGAEELPDGKDNDCDGQIDEGLECRVVWYRDVDGDGFGKPNLSIRSCFQPKGYVDNALDCRDEDKDVYPGAPELCDGKDNDCDGRVDESCGSLLITQFEKKGREVNNLSAKQAGANGLAISIWPNPAVNELNVSLDEFEAGKKVQISLISIDGRPVKSLSVMPELKGQQVMVNVRGMSSGYYVLKVEQGALFAVKKILVNP